MTDVAFIGLGRMGGPMAENLLKAGVKVRAFDISEKARAAIEAAGAEAFSTIENAVRGAAAVITMLPAGPQARAVYLGDHGVLGAAEPQALLLDCSTIDVATARDLARAAAAKGFAMVDAPVSGGVAAAAAGTLTFMVGGSEEAFARAEPVLKPMAGRIVHVGGAGNGQAAKICNNMLLAISMIGACEAFALAERLGLDARTFFDVASNASGQCWSVTSYCPAPGPVPSAPSNNGYRPGFSAAMMLKDLRLAQDAAASAKVSTPLGAQACAIYAMMEAAGEDGLDFSAVMKLVRGRLPDVV